MKNLNAYPLTQALIYDEIQRGKSNAVTSSIERNFFALFRPTILAFRGRLVQRHEGADLEIVWSLSTPFLDGNFLSRQCYLIMEESRNWLLTNS